MSSLELMKRGVILLGVVLTGIMPVFSASEHVRARDVVKATLKSEGVRIGVNPREKSYVFVGYHAAETNLTSGSVARMRESFFRQAVLGAKHDLMRARRLGVSSADKVEIAHDGSRQRILTTSMCRYLAEVEMHGSGVIASAESWNQDKGVYEVAVAVKWSAELEAEGVRLANKGLPIMGLREETSVWTEELRKYELPSLMGCRRFVDSSGKVRFFAAASRELGGKTPAQKVKSMRMAQMQASVNLASGLSADVAMRDAAVSVLRMLSARKITEAQAWEELVSRVVERNALTVRGREVFTDNNVVDPLTGKRVFVSVYGIELD